MFNFYIPVRGYVCELLFLSLTLGRKHIFSSLYPYHPQNSQIHAIYIVNYLKTIHFIVFTMGILNHQPNL